MIKLFMSVYCFRFLKVGANTTRFLALLSSNTFFFNTLHSGKKKKNIMEEKIQIRIFGQSHESDVKQSHALQRHTDI